MTIKRRLHRSGMHIETALAGVPVDERCKCKGVVASVRLSVVFPANRIYLRRVKRPLIAVIFAWVCFAIISCVGLSIPSISLIWSHRRLKPAVKQALGYLGFGGGKTEPAQK